VIAQLGGFAEGLVDDRVEGDDALQEPPSYTLGVIEIGCGNR
jgi:hypothetical protein